MNAHRAEEFHPTYGEVVGFLVGQDIEGVVTGILTNQPGSEQYQVAWFHNGDAKSGWFRPCELVPSKAKEAKP